MGVTRAEFKKSEAASARSVHPAFYGRLTVQPNPVDATHLAVGGWGTRKDSKAQLEPKWQQVTLPVSHKEKKSISIKIKA